VTATRRPTARRQGAGVDEVTNVELFFDLVYVFAVTQLSHLLVTHTTPDGAVQTLVLLALVWQVWVYTTWAVNYLDPDRLPTRVMLLLVMLASLVLAAALPEAFGRHGLTVAVAYVAIQAGRALFTVWMLRGDELQMVFVRILPWNAVSSTIVLVGAFQPDHVREVLWVAAIVVDQVGAAIGFWSPGLGRSATTDWTISGSHFAERCQAFVLIALGESIVVIGSLLHLDDPGWRDIVSFGAAFLGAVGLWWIYFDRAAGDSARAIAASPDPGRLARSAFHVVHPLIIGGIIVVAAADEKALDDPTAVGRTSTAWLILGGVALFLAGHAVFKAVVWRTVSWPRVVGVVVLAVLAALAPHVTALVLGCCALAVIVGVAIADHVGHPLPSAPVAEDVSPS
jgi:low temperature requirement protein LtrA